MTTFLERENAMSDLKYVYNDGGRELAGWVSGEGVGDCVTRSMVIASSYPHKPDGRHYENMREVLMSRTKEFRKKSRSRAAKSRRTNSVRNGTLREVYQPLLKRLGWEKESRIQFGSSQRSYMTTDDLPSGVVIVSLRNHLVTVIDHVVQDTWDCRTTLRWEDGVPTDEKIPACVVAVFKSG